MGLPRPPGSPVTLRAAACWHTVPAPMALPQCAGPNAVVRTHNRHDDAAIAHIVWRSELMRPTVIVLCSAVLLVSGCAQQATRSPAPAITPTTRPVALDGCVQPSSAQLIDLGGGNQAAVLGTGRLGTWSRPPPSCANWGCARSCSPGPPRAPRPH